MAKKNTPKPKHTTAKPPVSQPTEEAVGKNNLSARIAPTASSQPTWLRYALGVLVAGVTFMAFKGGFQNTFVEWDDNVYLLTNPLIQNPSWSNLGKVFSTSLSLNYHPLTVFTLMLNAMWGSGLQDATPFVVTNVLIHVGNVVLVYWLAARLSNQNWLVAAAVALLFGIHPMRVESVIWISERKDVLYTFFFLLACHTYLSYQQTLQRKFLIYTLVAFVLSCLSKAQAVVLPLVLMLLDYYENRDWKAKEVLLEKIPFFAIALLFGVIAMSIQGGGTFFGLIPSISIEAHAIDFEGFNLLDRIKMGMYGFMMYIVRIFYPVNLSPLYPFVKFADGSTPSEYLYGFLFFPLAWLLVYLSTKRTKLYALGMGFYFVTILLVLQFISVGVAIMADRYSYLPYFGLFFMLFMTLYRLTQPKPLLGYLTIGLTLAFAAWCFVLTTKQVLVWKTTETLFSRRIEIQPNDVRALAVRGNWYGENGQIDAAMVDLEKAVSLGLKQGNVFDKLGIAYGMKGQMDKALSYFDQALEVEPDNTSARYNRVMGLTTKDPQRALQDIDILMKSAANPQSIGSLKGYQGACYINLQQLDKALAAYNEAIDKYGNKEPQHLYNRGMLRLSMNDRNGAIQDLQKVLQVSPTNVQAKQQLQNLGVAVQ
ncbi:MAG: tetratricopeptide repeat protein [Spirosomataceae bacterium]